MLKSMGNWLDKKKFGDVCEDFAERWFLAKGCQILGRNVHFREGEIDLIVEKPALGGIGVANEILFVEVKGRRSLQFGSVVEALTTEKLRRIQRAVARWRNKTNDRRPGRILFLGIYQNPTGSFEVDEVEVE